MRTVEVEQVASFFFYPALASFTWLRENLRRLDTDTSFSVLHTQVHVKARQWILLSGTIVFGLAQNLDSKLR